MRLSKLAALVLQSQPDYGTIVPVHLELPVVVVDTSVVLAVLLNEPVRGRILARTRGVRIFVAPGIGWEVGNALVALVRRGRATVTDIEQAWRSFGKIPLSFTDCNVAASLRLATDAGLYAYDAYVIEAARAAGAPLMTLDRKQREAAVAYGVEIVEVD